MKLKRWSEVARHIKNSMNDNNEFSQRILFMQVSKEFLSHKISEFGMWMWIHDLSPYMRHLVAYTCQSMYTHSIADST